MDLRQLLAVADQLAELKMRVEKTLATLENQLPKSPPEAVEMARDGRCLNCGKKLDGKTHRGCHEYCYKSLKLKCKDVSDDIRMIEEGSWLLPEKGGRPKSAKSITAAEQKLDAEIDEAVQQDTELKKRRGSKKQATNSRAAD